MEDQHCCGIDGGLTLLWYDIVFKTQSYEDS